MGEGRRVAEEETMSKKRRVGREKWKRNEANGDESERVGGERLREEKQTRDEANGDKRERGESGAEI